jgi:hypothetical protein
MFTCSSVLDSNSPYHAYLHEHHWQIDFEGRLFTPIDNSEDLSNFLNLTLSRLGGQIATTVEGQAPSVSTTTIIAGSVGTINTAGHNEISGGTYHGPVVQASEVGEITNS